MLWVSIANQNRLRGGVPVTPQQLSFDLDNGDEQGRDEATLPGISANVRPPRSQHPMKLLSY